MFKINPFSAHQYFTPKWSVFLNHVQKILAYQAVCYHYLEIIFQFFSIISFILTGCFQTKIADSRLILLSADNDNPNKSSIVSVQSGCSVNKCSVKQLRKLLDIDLLIPKHRRNLILSFTCRLQRSVVQTWRRRQISVNMSFRCWISNLSFTCSLF